MGFVWNVVLSFSNEEFWEDGEDEPRATCEPLQRINEWISDGRLVDLTKPTYAKGAGSGLDANLYGGGFKHFDIEAFIQVVASQDWKDRAAVQLFVKGAEEGMGEGPFHLARLPRPRKSQPKKKTSCSVKRSPTANTKSQASSNRKRR
jgi:hypothetical protein